MCADMLIGQLGRTWQVQRSRQGWHCPAAALAAGCVPSSWQYALPPAPSRPTSTVGALPCAHCSARMHAYAEMRGMPIMACQQSYWLAYTHSASSAVPMPVCCCCIDKASKSHGYSCASSLPGNFILQATRRYIIYPAALPAALQSQRCIQSPLQADSVLWHYDAAILKPCLSFLYHAQDA